MTTTDSLQRIVAELRARAADQWTPNATFHLNIADRLERLSAAEQKVFAYVRDRRDMKCACGAVHGKVEIMLRSDLHGDLNAEDGWIATYRAACESQKATQADVGGDGV